MGIPPIHTPSEVLKNFPEKVKENMFLVHVSKDKIPPNCGLKCGETGLLNTYVLVQDIPPKFELFVKLNMLASISLFESLCTNSVRNILQVTKIVSYEPE